MTTTTGCLTLAGLVTLSMGVLDDARGASEVPYPCHIPKNYPNPFLDNLVSYAACGSNPEKDPNKAVCAASIKAAIRCAGIYFNDTYGYNSAQSYIYEIQLGTFTAGGAPLVFDLTPDTSLGSLLTGPAFILDGIDPKPFDTTNFTGKCGPSLATTTTSCLVIEGADATSSHTTLITPAGPAAISGTLASHLWIQNMTLMQHADAMVQGTVVCPPDEPSCQGSVTKSATVDGVTLTGTFATLEVAVNTPTNYIQDPNAFASIASPGDFGPCASMAASCIVAETFPAPTGCTAAIIDVLVSQDQNGHWIATGIKDINTPATCTSYPTPSSSSVQGTISGTSPAPQVTTPYFYVAYNPSPLSMWNVRQNSSEPTVGASIRAMTNALVPVKIDTSQDMASPAHGIYPKESWGNPALSNSVDVPTPPAYIPPPTGGPATWILTMNTALSAGDVDQAIEYIYAASTTPGTYDNLVCLHSDSGNAAFFDDRTYPSYAVGGYDITFDNVTWINAARATFRGVVGVTVKDSTIMRDPDMMHLTGLPTGQAPCFSAGSGGLQFGQPIKGANMIVDPAVFGNTVVNLTATATADDSIAMFDDNGTLTLPASLPQSSITASTIIDADDRSINIDNNPLVTSLLVGPTGTTITCPPSNTVTYYSFVDSGGTAIPPPVSIDSSTLGTITTYGHCDPCHIQCPVTITGVNNNPDPAPAP